MADSTKDERLAALLVRWEEAWEQGEDILVSELCAESPELTEQLAEKVHVLKEMAWMSQTTADLATDDADAEALLIGKKLGGRYRLDEQLAEGGFGRVYRGYDVELQRSVAVKIPKQDRRSGADDLLKEARRVSQLCHPGIVAVHDVGQDDGLLFVVSDLVEGATLAEVIADNHPSPGEASRLAAQLADALQHAHVEGFVHRDIKPANVLLDQEGRPHITDFGIAVTAKEASRSTRFTAGTLLYMAPEQLSGDFQLIGPRTDIYALGVVLFQLLTGRCPFPGRTITALREQILFQQPQSIAEQNPDVPADLAQICLKCLAKHPANRFGSAAELATALRSATQNTNGWSRRHLLGAGLVAGLATATFIATKFVDLSAAQPKEVPLTGSATNEAQSDLIFDGSGRILTPVERFAPVTLEAWIWPLRYEDRVHTVIGSDVPSEWGIGVGVYGVMLGAEYIPGTFKSDRIVPISKWTHIAAVFADDETRLYFNGTHVETGPATKQVGGTKFVIGNSGENSPRDFFLGRVHSLRISTGERFSEDFTPARNFERGEDADAETVLIYEGSAVEGDRVIDLSGAGNHGIWQRFGAPTLQDAALPES